MKVLSSLLIAAAILVVAAPSEAKPKKREKERKNPVVLIKTSMGDIKVELDQKNAPISTANFLKYVDEKFYDGTIFHRVISGFMIQGGGMTPDMHEKETHSPIKNEGQNGLKNTRGTIAMARTNVLDSATAQFFINVVDNPFLDYPSGGGYAVFGKVLSGMDAVDKIRQVPTKPGDVPTETVVIESIRETQSEVPRSSGGARNSADRADSDSHSDLGVSGADNKKSACEEGWTAASKGICYQMASAETNFGGGTDITFLLRTKRTYVGVGFTAVMYKGGKVVCTAQALANNVVKGQDTAVKAMCLKDIGTPDKAVFQPDYAYDQKEMDAQRRLYNGLK